VQKVPAGDLIARWAYSSLHSRATANLARVFLEELLRKCPFPVRAIQVDGGSEFYGEFEKACKEYGIKLFVLPPRSPISVEWWNGSTGPSGRVLRYSEDEVDLATMRFHLKRWTEEVYNRKRPHWSLGRGALGGAERHRTC
jgi:transposase InsO family protein